MSSTPYNEQTGPIPPRGDITLLHAGDGLGMMYDRQPSTSSPRAQSISAPESIMNPLLHAINKMYPDIACSVLDILVGPRWKVPR